MMKFDEKKLISQSLNGDNKALGMLLDSVWDMVYRLSLKKLENTADAKDATQDIMLKIMMELASFMQLCSFSTWVYRLANNYLVNLLKSASNKFLQYSDSLVSSDVSYEHKYADLETDFEHIDFIHESRVSCLAIFLQCLDPQSRIIYILSVGHKIDGITAGNILDISPEAYRQRLCRAKKKLSAFKETHCRLNCGQCGYKKQIDAIKPYPPNQNKEEHPDYSVVYDALVRGNAQAMELLESMSDVYRRIRNDLSRNNANKELSATLDSHFFWWKSA